MINNQWSKDQINHPLLKPPGYSCRKCASHRILLPAYHGDFFDCLDCGHSWPTTAAQLEYMKRNPAALFDKNGRIPKDRAARYL